MTGFWHRWMVIWCWAILIVGAVFAASAIPALRWPTLLFLDIVFWPIDGQPATLSREAAFGVALSGALLTGWAVLMLGLARDPKLSREPRVWWLMTSAILVWFVVDSAASWLTGASVNVLSNSLFVAAYLLPILKSGVLSNQDLTTRPA